MSAVGARIKVSGMVQGVGYRYFCWQRARQLHLNGFVRNMPDGSVELRVEGKKDMIETMLNDLRAGPSLATVSDVNVEWVEHVEEFHSFEISG